MNYIKKLSLILVYVIALNFVGHNSIAVSAVSSTQMQESIFVDGVEYISTINYEGYTVVYAVDGSLRLYLSPYGEVTVIAETENGSTDEVFIEIEELSHEEVEATVYYDSIAVVEIDCFEDIGLGEYTGQAAAGALLPATVSLSTVLIALLLAAGAVVIAGLTVYAVSVAIDIVRRRFNDWQTRVFPASQVPLLGIVMAVTPVTRERAISGIRSGRSFYTNRRAESRVLVNSAGLGVRGPENHSRNSFGIRRVGVFYWHYHTGNRNGAHVWYGSPV